jgi:vacuolar-type H+-ATPase catalytic subunit A/Vma1
MSSNLRQAATDAANASATPKAKAQAALYIALTSSEYQVIH